MTGTRSLIGLLVILGALVALYGALVLPRASTSAADAVPADAPVAVLAASRDAETGDGCPRLSEEDADDGAVTLRPVA